MPQELEMEKYPHFCLLRSWTPSEMACKNLPDVRKITGKGCKMCAWVHQFNTLERAKKSKILKKNRALGASAAVVGRVKEQKHARSHE